MSKKIKHTDLPSIADIEDEGNKIDSYPIDESMDNPNAGDAVVYDYNGKKYQVITWNEKAEQQRAGDKTINELDDDDEFASGGSISKSKARKILHDGTVHGHPLTEKQRKFFGARASGYPEKKASGGILLSDFENYYATHGALFGGGYFSREKMAGGGAVTESIQKEKDELLARSYNEEHFSAKEHERLRELLGKMGNYQSRLNKFDVEENADAPNYVKAIKWAKANGYYMSDDTSYNGYIFFEKIICDGEHKLQLQVYDDIKKKAEPNFTQYNKEADFGQSILSETTYRFKQEHDASDWNSKDLDELFALAIRKEKELEASCKMAGGGKVADKKKSEEAWKKIKEEKLYLLTRDEYAKKIIRERLKDWKKEKGTYFKVTLGGANTGYFGGNWWDEKTLREYLSSTPTGEKDQIAYVEKDGKVLFSFERYMAIVRKAESENLYKEAVADKKITNEKAKEITESAH